MTTVKYLESSPNPNQFPTFVKKRPDWKGLEAHLPKFTFWGTHDHSDSLYYGDIHVANGDGVWALYVYDKRENGGTIDFGFGSQKHAAAGMKLLTDAAKAMRATHPDFDITPFTDVSHGGNQVNVRMPDNETNREFVLNVLAKIK